MRNPDWVRDEIILAMDLFLRADRKQLSRGHEEVVRLSQLLNRLPIHPTLLRDKDFRNPNGISMILGNFLAVDPLNVQSGLSRKNHLQESIWEEFVDSPSRLHRTAEAIRSAISENTEGYEGRFNEEDVFPEGHILTRQHLVRERNRAAVVAKLDLVWGRDGLIACEVCGFDYLQFYGELGRQFAECHHVVPLAEAALDRRTRLVDLAIVCANCHRMLHRARPTLTVDALRELIGQAQQSQLRSTV